MEIEKKYLVEKIPFPLAGFPSHAIRQGYLSIDPVIRIRQSDGDYILTVKGDGLFAREEFELPLIQAQFLSLQKKLDTIMLEKTRFLIPLECGLTAELDLYYGELDGLLTVEVEFASIREAEAFRPPEWFGREVTYDKKYKNSSLITNGLPKFQ